MSNVEAVPVDIGHRAKCLTIIRIKFYGLAAMIVCICKAVSDKHIRRAASEGVVRLRDLSRELGLGTCCGKCVPEAREVLSQAVGSRPMELGELLSPSLLQASA